MRRSMVTTALGLGLSLGLGLGLAGCRNYKLTEGDVCSSSKECIDQKCIEGICGGPKGNSGSGGDGDGDGDGDTGIDDIPGDGDGDGDGDCTSTIGTGIYFYTGDADLSDGVDGDRLTQAFDAGVNALHGSDTDTSSYKTFVVLNPMSFAVLDVADELNAHLGNGGRVVVVGDCESDGAACNGTYDVLNGLLEKAGGEAISFNNELEVEGDYTLTTAEFVSSLNLFDGIETVDGSGFGQLVLNQDNPDTEVNGLAQVEVTVDNVVDNVSIMARETVGCGELLVLTDISMFTTERLDDETDNNDNEEFVRRLLDTDIPIQ